MKRTLLAVGVAVLVSMMWIPEYVPYVGRYRLPSVILSEAKNLWSSLQLISSRQLEMSRFCST
jgi:hypothetical protein